MSDFFSTFAPDFLSRIRTRTIFSVISILEYTRNPTCAKNAQVRTLAKNATVREDYYG